MSQTIAAICNIFNDAKALPGWLESASAWADHITVYHTGPQGERSSDGTIEIAEAWGVDLQFGSIDEGFGTVRTKMVTMTPCDWVWIGDADERFHRIAPKLYCEGNEAYPAVEHPNLSVIRLGFHPHDTYDQLDLLRSMMTADVDAICTVRRHWFNHHWDKPCQNWMQIADWQLRIVRNCQHVSYLSSVRMHEQIRDTRTGGDPRFARADVERGPFHDHYHCWYKAMEKEQRQHDIAIYDSLCENRTPPTLAEFRNRDGQSVEPQGDAA